MAKVMKIKCSGCGEVIELPDDPRIGELKDTIEKQSKVIERLVDKLEEAAKPPLEPKPKRTETQVVRHEGPIFTIEEEEEVEVDE